ncbi:MAG: alanine--tRNA ligase [Anaerolineales bacterium]
MSQKRFSGAEIRQTFIDFFVQRGHTFVPSSSLVPGGDATLLFTNSGMVQFKDVFLGTDKRPYTRAANSQKCMRVAGKHNDLEDVGRDDTHHTFFEMLGNWSFGDYYKKEAIAWAWELLTEVWGLPKERLWATCFKDEKGRIPTDDEAADYWRAQPGFLPDHVLFFGRKENFWEMAETGPCGPCSEIHIDRGEEYCDKKGEPGHVCRVNGDCKRFLELWNLVFMQYNRLDPDTLEPLPAKHVDTGMGLERIVAVLQNVNSNYKTDLFTPLIERVRALTGHSLDQVYADFTPYRVIADHSRAAAFLIADGVVPGNTGRNYVCRMVIRRAARFGTKIGLNQPFLAEVAEAVIENYGHFYPELQRNRAVILDTITREEKRFARALDLSTNRLLGMLDELRQKGERILSGRLAFDLYATSGMPFEIARDIAREQGMDVEERGFQEAMEEHRLASGAGKAMGPLGGEDAEFFSGILQALQQRGEIGAEGVLYDPYTKTQVTGKVLALVREGQEIEEAETGDRVEVILPETGFYIEAGGQVSDTGTIRAVDGSWEIEVQDMRKPAAGVITHVGEVIFGKPRRGDLARAEVDMDRRHDIMRNHTATHLLHAALHQVLGPGALQAGSLVAPDRLRFDFNYPQALTAAQLAEIERRVNEMVAADWPVQPTYKTREEAIAEGAMALFGEKYGEIVRTLRIGDENHLISYELCGGTHLSRTSDVGMFLIVSESSVGTNVRRIEAVTGRGAYQLVARRFAVLQETANLLKTTPEEVAQKVEALQEELQTTRKALSALQKEHATLLFRRHLQTLETIGNVNLLIAELPGLDDETLRALADLFRQEVRERGVCVVATRNTQVRLMVALTADLVKSGWKAGEMVNYLARQLGGGGGGAPHLALGGGSETQKLPEALESARRWVEEKATKS